MENTGILRTISKLWNGTTATGDPFIGGAAATTPNLYLGQLGAVAQLSFNDAATRSDPASATPLQGGRYQYVQYAADGTAYTQGQVLYWKDETNFIVTNVPGALTVAGIATAPVTQGNYWLMVTDGVAYVTFAAGLTTPAIGQPIFSNQATPAVAVNAATAGTAILAGGAVVGLSQYIGVAKDLPVSATTTRVYLKNLTQVQ